MAVKWQLTWLLRTVADLHGVDDRIAEVGPELGIEGAAAGNETQLRVGSRAVHGQRGETILGVRPDSCNAEDRQRSVRPPHVDMVAGPQLRQVEEDAGTGVRVDMPGYHRRPDRTGPRTAGIPARDHRRWRHRERAGSG